MLRLLTPGFWSDAINRKLWLARCRRHARYPLDRDIIAYGRRGEIVAWAIVRSKREPWSLARCLHHIKDHGFLAYLGARFDVVETLYRADAA